MKKNILLQIILLIVLITALGGSYYYFSTYHPKVLRKIAEVRGLRTKSFVNLPHPELIEKLDTSKIKGYNRLTYRTPLDPTQIQSFYENVFNEDDWELDSITYENNELYMIYKSKDIKTIIQAIKENPEGNTLVSVHESQR